MMAGFHLSLIGSRHPFRGSLLLLPLVFISCQGDATGPGKSTLGIDGGTVKLAKGAVSLTIPSGTLSETVTFTASETSAFPSSELVLPGTTFEIGPTGTPLSKLITVTLSYDPGDLPPGVREGELRLVQSYGTRWELLLNPAVDTEAHEVSGRTDRLGVFGVSGVPVATVSVSPTFFTLEEGQTKALSAVGKDASSMSLPDRPVTWSSANAAVASVDAEGVVTGQGIGSTTITATVEGFSAQAQFRVFSCSGQTEIPTSECDALIALYDGMNDTDWRYSPSWVPTPAPCGWRGVTCNEGTVRRLALSGKGLKGTLSTSIGDLAGLVELDLGGNQLAGPLPTSLGNLHSLVRLDLAANDFSGPIPGSLQNLTELTEVDLSSNELTGPIPSGLGTLTKLTNLNLAWNALSGSIPPELGSLHELLDLGLIDNQLTGTIPPALGGMAKLQRLSLAVNQLTGSIPAQLGTLSNLVTLGLDRNQLSGLIPAALGNLGNLNGLYLWENQLTGQVPIAVARLGGSIQARSGGALNCAFTPPGNTGLSMPDTQEFRDADQDGDGKICGVQIGGE